MGGVLYVCNTIRDGDEWCDVCRRCLSVLMVTEVNDDGGL